MQAQQSIGGAQRTTGSHQMSTSQQSVAQQQTISQGYRLGGDDLSKRPKMSHESKPTSRAGEKSSNDSTKYLLPTQMRDQPENGRR